MYHKRTLFATLVILLTVTIFTCSVKANEVADSIRMQMEHLSGQELLQAHSNLCRLAAGEDNLDNELATLRAYINESNSQGNVEAEGQARSMQIMCFYNYGLPDSLTKALPVNLTFMGEHGLWDHYYNSWNTLVELYIYEDKLQKALREAEKMYADAKENQSNYGIGVSAYCMGSIYQTMQRFTEAAKALEESVQTLSKEDDISLLLSAYNALGETLDGLGEYEQLRSMTAEWKSVLDKYKYEALAKGYTPSLNGRYLYCTLAAAVAEIETEQYDKAADLLSKAEVFAEGRNLISRYKLLQVKARYYAATKQYDKAIAYNKENMAILLSVGDSISLLTVELQQAEFLLAAGQHKESAELYKKIIPRKDELRNSELTAQLDELHTIYEVDKLTLKNKISTHRLYFLFVFIVLLLIVMILYIIYNRRLSHKNRKLFDTIAQSQKTEDLLCVSKKQVVKKKLSSEEILFHKLSKLMQDEHLFKDHNIRRDDLASMLSTNRTYLANAIKKCADDLTFTEYLNRHRLRHAANLLTNNPDLNIYEVGDESGFNSRSTYYRLFREYYGMSPSEYRAISKEKKIN